MNTKIVPGIAGILCAGMVQAAEVNLLNEYRNAGAGPFSAAAGQSAWTHGS